MTTVYIFSMPNININITKVEHLEKKTQIEVEELNNKHIEKRLKTPI